MSHDGPDGFNQVNRPGSVDIESEYDTSGATIPLDEVHTLLPRDAIPALTDPKLITIGEASYLSGDDRVMAVTVGGETVGVPIKILNFHEVANMTIGGEPVAATYCPLCDSATVISRRVETDEGETEVLEFGVSGALYNSNVLMYDTTHKALWSQLAMNAVTGPYAGRELEHLPVRIVTLDALRDEHPGAMVLSNDTGHTRPYDRTRTNRTSPTTSMSWSMSRPTATLCPKRRSGSASRPAGSPTSSPERAITERFVIRTPEGDVVAVPSDAGVMVVRAPDGVRTVQSFYYAFSAFHPETEVVEKSAE